MLLIVATLVGLLALLMGSLRGRVTPYWVTLAYLITVWIGYVLLDGDEVSGSTVLYTVLIVAMTVGYLAGRAVGIHRLRAIDVPPDTRLRATDAAHAARQLKVVLGVVTVLCLYHFARIGLPVFADDIELSRWKTTESGLYGIPSRAFQIGVPTAYFFAAVLWARVEVTHRHSIVRLRQWAIALLVITRLVSGFKGGLVQVIIVVFMAQLLSGTDRQRLRNVSVKFALPVLIGFGFAVFIGSLYGGVNARIENNGGTVTSLFVDRATKWAAEPSLVLLEGSLDNDKGALPSEPFTHDFVHYVRTYTPSLSSDEEPFSKHINSVITGRPLDGELFIVPTTPGILATTVFAFGPELGALLVLCLGLFYGYLEVVPRMTRSAFGTAIWTAAVFNVHLAFTKGNLVYQAINFTVMALLLYLLVLQVPRRIAPNAPARVGVRARA